MFPKDARPFAEGPTPSVLGTIGLALAILIVAWAASEGAPEPDGGATCRASMSWRAHGIFAIAWSPDGRRLAASGWGPRVRVWEPEGGVARSFEADDDAPRFVQGWAVGADGPTVGGLDGRAGTWDRPGSPAEEAMATSLAGLARSAAGRGESIRLWGPGDRRAALLPAEARAANSVAFSPDGRLFAAAGRDGTIRVGESASGRVLHRWPTDGIGVNGVAFSPDGARVASAGGGPARLWDVASGRLLGRFGDAAGGFSSVAFSPDGRGLAGATWAGRVQVWDLATGRARADLASRGGQVLAMAWSPDGSSLATGGHDATVRVWDLAPGP